HPRVVREELPGVGEPYAPAGLLEQRCGDLLLQQGKLLRDRGRAVPERCRDSGQGTALRELPKQQQPAKVQRDHAGMLTNHVHKSSLDLMGSWADAQRRGSGTVSSVRIVLRGDADLRKVRVRGGCLAYRAVVGALQPGRRHAGDASAAAARLASYRGGSGRG